MSQFIADFFLKNYSAHEYYLQALHALQVEPHPCLRVAVKGRVNRSRDLLFIQNGAREASKSEILQGRLEGGPQSCGES